MNMTSIDTISNKVNMWYIICIMVWVIISERVECTAESRDFLTVKHKLVQVPIQLRGNELITNKF